MNRNRFIIRFFLYTALATVIWWLIDPASQTLTVRTAKLLHSLAGYPAPYLLADIESFYWFNPLVPPLIGLVLASDWLSWRRRSLALAIGWAAFVYLVSLQIAILYSPYLTNSAVRAYLISMQVALNTVVVPVVLWLIATGGPPDRSETPSHTDPSTKTARRAAPRPATIALLTLVFCGMMTIPVALAAEKTHPDLSAARRELAQSLKSKHFSGSLKPVEKMLRYDRGNTAIGYLNLELRRRLGQADYVEQNVTRILGSGSRARSYRRYMQLHAVTDASD